MSEKLTISYIGTMSSSYPVYGLMKAITSIKDKIEIDLRFVGVVSEDTRELISQTTNVEFIKYCDHAEAIKYMTSADVLLLVIPDHKGNESIITGKIYEYLATCKPILGLGPVTGDAAGILSNTGHGLMFDYSDSEGIANYLYTMIYDI